MEALLISFITRCSSRLGSTENGSYRPIHRLLGLEEREYYPSVRSHFPWQLVITLNKLLRMLHSLLSTVRLLTMPYWAVLPSIVEGRNFNLSPDVQVSHWVQSRRGTWRPSGSVRVLYSNVGDGQPLIDHEHRRTMDGCRACWRVGIDTLRWLQT